MNARAKQKPGNNLREVARLVVKDGVSSSVLTEYLDCFTEETLVELDAPARICAALLSAIYPGLSSGELAAVLIAKANELDKA